MDPNQIPPNQGQPGQTPPHQMHPGQQPMHVQPSAESNTIAVVGLVLAFVFWPAGLVCSIMGLNKAKELGGNGHGMALAGLIVSIVGGVLGIIWTILFFVAGGLAGLEEAERQSSAIRMLLS